MPPLDVLYHEGPCLAINKPSGLATQAPPEFDSAEVSVKEYIRSREGQTGKVYLGVPHRLDRPVSGVLLFARHVRAARRISQQFERREVKKVYWALVEGLVTPESGRWHDHLKKVYGHPRTEVVGGDDPLGRMAVLHYRTLGQLPRGEGGGSVTWLEIELETGRTHQIRVQAATRGWPVLGDLFYGAKRAFGPHVSEERDRAIALHARSLSFRHPINNEPRTITAPLPAAWRDAGVEPEAEA